MPVNFLIPRGKLDKILPSCTRRRDSETLLRSFAAELGIAPGIVVGYLQKLGLLPENWCNHLERHLEWAPPGTEADPQVY